MEGIVRTALQAARPGGATFQYFKEEAHWQGPLRQQLALLVETIPDDPRLAREAGVILLNEVRVRYRTQRSVTGYQLEGIYDDCVQSLDERRWLTTGPPSLLTHTPNFSADIALVYTNALKRVCQRPGKRPFSLLSKWLHLCYPDSFVIYDRNAAASIKCWSDHTHCHLSMKAMQRLQFDVENSDWVRNWSEIGWYLGLLRFYQQFCQTAEELGLSTELQEAATGLENLLYASGEHQVQVSVTTIVDGLLWRANGDAATLGLA